VSEMLRMCYWSFISHSIYNSVSLWIPPIMYLHQEGEVYSRQHCTKSSLSVIKNSKAVITVWKLGVGEANYQHMNIMMM
jgi:hypothetical protein